MCSWATVEDVPQDMQAVNAQLLNDRTDGRDEILSLSRQYDALYDAMEVGFLVIVARTLVQHLLYDVCKLVRQGFAHLASGVFAAYRSAYLYETE